MSDREPPAWKRKRSIDMALSEDRIVLAVECGYCSQITGVPVYNGTLRIARCGGCGKVFRTTEALVHQYQTYAERIEKYDSLLQALQEAREAIALALQHWGRKAGKEALSQALSVRSTVGQDAKS
jgi:hypothetical protein